ncbi:unnamed protein product [marine sediment metagenome]|uniref:Uncharacterized protein n=1 Tax=marine sediment metagenome TaxID=412755 RepID=X1QVL3_9ZZZZ
MTGDKNPRGEERPHDGRGGGVGMEGGLRGGRNTEPCETGEGEGFSMGGGRGSGRGRKDRSRSREE